MISNVNFGARPIIVLQLFVILLCAVSQLFNQENYKKKNGWGVSLRLKSFLQKNKKTKQNKNKTKKKSKSIEIIRVFC